MVNYPFYMNDKVAEKLTEYIRKLASGGNTREVWDQYSEFLEACTAVEVNYAIDEYMSGEDDFSLIEITVARFIRACGRGLDKIGKFKPDSGSFIDALMRENREIEKERRLATEAFSSIASDKGRSSENYAAVLWESLAHLSIVSSHYSMLQNALFPALEQRGDNMNCLRLMWHIQDDIVASMKKLSAMIAASDIDFETFNKLYGSMYLKMGNLIYREEMILYPLAAELFPLDVHQKLLDDLADLGAEIGLQSEGGSIDVRRSSFPSLDSGAGTVNLNTGTLDPTQIDLILTNLPFDITYVDEDDRVRYFSRGKERLFPRSPGIIGRPVVNCHPPNSVHIVEKIISDFREGRRDSAEFWIQNDGMFILIRYYPLFDGDIYRGVLEVSQDITGIRTIDGEKRLLDEI